MSIACARATYLIQSLSVCGKICPIGWTMEGCKCFKVFKKKETHSDAEARCIKMGGNLASVTTQEIQDRLLCAEEKTDFWIGLNDVDLEGTYVWPNGEEYGSYTNWGTHHHTPNNRLQHVKVDVSLRKWKNIAGDKRLFYACELDLSILVNKTIFFTITMTKYCRLELLLQKKPQLK